MKCDELEKFDAASNADLSAGYDHRYAYDADEVDAAIAELKAENERLKKCEIWMKQHFYCEEVIACESAKNRRLKRALWLARAKRATEKADSFIDIKVTYNGVCNIDHSVYPQNNARRMLTCDEWLDVWTNVWEKCLKKAKEYR